MKVQKALPVALLAVLISMGAGWTLVGAGDGPPGPRESARQTSPLRDLTWVRTGGPPGGLGYDIRFNYADPNTWYVTDNFAGVFMSSDNGYGWFPSNSGIPAQGGPTGDYIPIFSLTVDPHNPQIVWAGTDLTGHIYKSTDGGQTWTEKDNGVEFGGYDSFSFRGFTVDPYTSDTVYAMGELKDESVGGTSVWGLGIGGRVYKTTDGGEYWQIIWDGGVPSSLTRYMWINPRDPANLTDDVLFVSTGIFDRGAVGETTAYGIPTDPDPFGGLGVLRSTDSGQTWEVISETHGLEMLYIGSLYMDPLDPNTLLAAAGHIITAPAADAIQQSGHAPGGVFRTTDGGDHWTKVLTATGSLLLENMSAVEICPPPYNNIAYAGGSLAIYRSTNGGVDWTVAATHPAGWWGPPGVQAGWPIDLQCDPRDPDRVFANNYNGGAFLSEDGGHTWQNASQGYTGAQMRGLAVDPANPARLYAAGRSGPWRTDTGGTAWIGLRYPDPAFPGSLEFASIAVDLAQPERILSGNDTIQESPNRGMDWHDLWSPAPEQALSPETDGVATAKVIGIIDLVFAPSDPNRVYAGVGDIGSTLLHEPCAPSFGIASSQDRGISWTLSADPDVQDLSVIDLAVDPADALKVYAAAETGLFQSTDGGVEWTVVPITGQPVGVRVRAVAVSPADSQRLLAAVDGQFTLPGTVPGIFASSDGGSTWQPSYAGLEPNGSIHDIVFDPVNPQTVYASDYLSGVYRSTNGGQTWVQINVGLRNRAAGALAITADGQHLYAATSGEGVYRLDLNGEPPIGPVEWQYVYLPLIVK